MSSSGRGWRNCEGGSFREHLAVGHHDRAELDRHQEEQPDVAEATAGNRQQSVEDRESKNPLSSVLLAPSGVGQRLRSFPGMVSPAPMP